MKSELKFNMNKMIIEWVVESQKETRIEIQHED